jgi:sugar lactone lactonase YvrE
MLFPNGSVVTPAGNTLIVGESYGARLTAFDIEPDGSLANRRIFASLAPNVPDGICLDAEGAVWVADPLNNECIRVIEGGQVTHRVKTGRGCFACMLGGPDRRTLFLLTAETSVPDEAREKRTGRVEVTVVDVPGDGLP